MAKKKAVTTVNLPMTCERRGETHQFEAINMGSGGYATGSLASIQKPPDYRLYCRKCGEVRRLQ